MSRNSDRYSNRATGDEPSSNNCSQSEAYENLRNAIILQAVYDYRKALRSLQQNNTHKPFLRMKSDCEDFFSSEWFSILTDLDGNLLMQKLKEEVEK